MESSPSNAISKPKKLSLKFKLLVYLGWNISTLLLSAINVLQGASPGMTLLIFLGNVVVMNFCFWYLFRARDRSVGNA
jgi:hypothetical protein